MAYALKHRTAVDQDVRRVMADQLAKARESLDTVGSEPAQAIHECRTRCKKIRGAVRLVRPAVVGDGYSTVNGLARDAARELAPLRDATAMAVTFERLVEHWSGDGREAMERAGAALTARRRRREDAAAAGHPGIERASELLDELGEAIDDLELDATGFDAIGPGVAKTYGRGRTALAAAPEAPTGPNFHEWRKRVKYTRYHLRLLRRSAPSVLDPLEDAFHDLTDALGDAHDLVVLGVWLRSGDVARELGDTTELQVLVDGVRAELERRAVALGRRLYAESSKRFTERLGAYWETWSAEETRSPAGELELVLG